MPGSCSAQRDEAVRRRKNLPAEATITAVPPSCDGGAEGDMTTQLDAAPRAGGVPGGGPITRSAPAISMRRW